TSGPSSILGEEIPAGVLSDGSSLQLPPQPIPANELLPENLPAAWSNGAATALTIAKALSDKVGKILPWVTVRKVIDGAFSARLLERAQESGPWPCEYAGANSVTLRVPAKDEFAPPPPQPPPPRPGIRVAEAELRPNELQDLADVVGKI